MANGCPVMHAHIPPLPFYAVVPFMRNTTAGLSCASISLSAQPYTLPTLNLTLTATTTTTTTTTHPSLPPFRPPFVPRHLASILSGPQLHAPNCTTPSPPKAALTLLQHHKSRSRRHRPRSTAAACPD
ncbi:hypothetical protein CDEST_00374 [Colletotrichum destructivum]|uniref:Uncharacterized protein n=1 Tax=Colletotrichum destructivum TaxID=34406 RepID=A0AAX4HWV4_9PEZI|nr:hypothetical protein CDEST_00374 [Colletotrichum destructivum]